ncbi:FtsX-like permease family protein [Campylobacter sp.]|uniref:FtsX-like permease family protein n=1 Tax=Campylobacter sp. TaxID=205 RepID=UPI00270DFE90|nr:cell division protein FtsX [Campylobacter sp.]
MRSLKNHFGVIFPLVALLFSMQFITLTENTIKDYERLMNNDYSIIIVSSKELDDAMIKPIVNTFASLETLSSKSVLDRLSKDVSAKNISALQEALPKFYSLKLNSFPSTSYMNEIRDKVLKLDGVSRVETFSKTHDKIYKILQLIKKISQIFSVLILVVGLMLLFKQMRIWLYEHKERIDIMTLFGASFWIKSGVLYKIAVIDSFIATVIVVAVYYMLPDFEAVNTMVRDLGVKLPQIDIINDTATLLGVSLLLSAAAVSLVMRQAKKESL